MVATNGDLLACHFGLWGPDTTSDREALIRSNHTLVQGCGLDPGRRVLDAGCGVGGTAIMLAKHYGVHVTGLTNCEPHVEVAAKHAEQQGVGKLVEFLHGDFMELPFTDSCFDAVINHESFCYAPDKLAYLQGVYRVLKPGGRWQALEGLLSGVPMSESQQAIHLSMQWGFRMPPLASWREVSVDLEEAGFEEIHNQDLASEVAQSTDRTRNRWLLFLFLNLSPQMSNQAHHEFMQAAMDFDEGLQEGIFTYLFISGTKPI
ncbi:MAG: methyltransferase domain-containing protein [Gammaproteobacteria bacterium]|nr:methyltransferase domain-containing protein [Gammaproteobacteria bacterium]